MFMDMHNAMYIHVYLFIQNAYSMRFIIILYIESVDSCIKSNNVEFI